MEEELLRKFGMGCREEMVGFLKSLWRETPAPCPLCGGRLDYLHKKAKKSACDWVCTGCGERFDTIRLLNRLNERERA